MTTTFLEIDSTYRNRVEYKHASNFVVPISQRGSRGRYDALDPIALSAPTHMWTPSDIDNMNPDLTQSPLPTSPQVAEFPAPTPTEIYTKYTIAYGSSTPNAEHNYYAGMSIVVTDMPAQPTPATSTVVGSEVMTQYDDGQNNVIVVKYNISPPITTSNGSYVSLEYPGVKSGLMTIPGNPAQANGYYNDWYIYNHSLKAGIQIISYDGRTRTAGFIAPPESSQFSQWEKDHTYSLRRELPIISSTAAIIDALTVEIPWEDAPTLDGAYEGFFISLFDLHGSYSTHRIARYEVVHIPDQNPSAVGQYERPRYLIHLYRPLGLVRLNLALFSEQGPEPTDPLTATTPYEILPFSRDSVQPFVYTGSLGSQQQKTCYEIELLNLVIPNEILVTGGLSAFYPYLYVELSNTAHGAGTNHIYSNNPNATKALFRCAIDDMPSVLVTPWVKIDSDGQKQTVKFNMNDSLHFRVYTPNGEDFRTVQEEDYSPLPVNPLIQISAIFSMRRL